MKKFILVLVAGITLSACSSEKPSTATVDSLGVDSSTVVVVDTCACVDTVCIDSSK